MQLLIDGWQNGFGGTWVSKTPGHFLHVCTINSGNVTTVHNCKHMCQDRKEELMNNKMFWVHTGVNSQSTLPNMSSGV